VVAAPIVNPARASPLTPASSRMPRRPISVFGSNWPRFMLGNKSVPPATSMASGPRSARFLTASSTVRGAT